MGGKTGVPEKCFIFWGGIIDFPGRGSFAIASCAKRAFPSKILVKLDQYPDVWNSKKNLRHSAVAHP
jgi:hypothetical protein